MALVLSDRVQETSTTSGTGTLTLNGAVNGYQSFANGVGNGNTCYYTIYDTVAYTWEVGIGTYTTSGSTLTRTTVLSNSSQTTSLINFAGNLMNVWVDYPAEKAIYQDASGNTYVPSLGGTTPSTGTFTTITGQTETLKGTGQNLITNSTSIATTWSYINLTTTTGQTDPFGGTNAVLINDGVANGDHKIQQQIFATTNATTTTFSVYLKAGTANFGGIYFYSTGQGVFFNLTTGAFVNNIASAPASYTSTNIGNGWWRYSITTNVYNSSGSYFQIFMSETGSGTTGYTGTNQTIYVSSPQFELGSVTNTYFPTTTTAIYGTPTLSFSGVSTIGLQNDGSLFVQPAGTGALQAQQTTSSATGGNARGANAVDWQTARSSAASVASSSYGVVSGGYDNRATGGYGGVGSGLGNIASATASYVGTGNGNTASGYYASVFSGHNNTAAGYFNFIGNGDTNSGTSNSAVTTQATTTVTSGSTAVTLSGSNASIKVGQFITGTGIPNFTYVSAISGTSLTLSQNANASGSPTLSFFTPHGIVVGGGNNQATGAYSFIGGGGDAGTAANRNVASGDWSFVGGGNKNTASGILSTVAGGLNNTASGEASFVGGGGDYGNFGYGGNTASGLSSGVLAGYGNQASAAHSSVLAGGNNQASGNYSAILAGYYNTTRGITGVVAFAGRNNISATNGQSQSEQFVLTVQTTNATATELLSDNASTPSSTNIPVLPAPSASTSSVYTFRGLISAKNTATTDVAGWEIKGVIQRTGSGVGTVAMVGSPTITLLGATSGAISAGWGTVGSVTAVADTTYGGLGIKVTGAASTTINWNCRLDTAELL